MQKNNTFRIFYAKLCILLSVDGSTNRRNEIILGGHYNYQIRYLVKELLHVCAYLGDILITGESREAHLEIRRRVLTHFETSGLNVNNEKC